MGSLRPPNGGDRRSNVDPKPEKILLNEEKFRPLGRVVRMDGEASTLNQALPSNKNKLSLSREWVVPEVGIEPTRGCPRRILNPVRLPISPLRHSGSLLLPSRKYTIPTFKLPKFSGHTPKIIYIRTNGLSEASYLPFFHYKKRLIS